jgi:hypothetical protein
MILVLFPPDVELVNQKCQRSMYHHTGVVYNGKDKAACLQQHFCGIAEQIWKLQCLVFFWRYRHVLPYFLMPVDMASHFRMYGC